MDVSQAAREVHVDFADALPLPVVRQQLHYHSTYTRAVTIHSAAKHTSGNSASVLIKEHMRPEATSNLGTSKFLANVAMSPACIPSVGQFLEGAMPRS